MSSSYLSLGPYIVNWVMQVLAEVRVRGAPSEPRYIAGYRPQAPGQIQAQVVYPQVQVVPVNGQPIGAKG